MVSELNDYQFKLVKVKDDFVWHHHSNSDETFIVVKGKLFIDFKNKTEEILKLGPASGIAVLISSSFSKLKEGALQVTQ